MSKSLRPSDLNTQIDRFKEAARQLEADENETAFDKKLRDVAGHKPPAKPKEQP